MNTIATPVALPDGDRRTTVPLFTLHECARYLHTPLSTLHSWAKPTSEVPLITTLPSAGRQATIPFVGFAEAFVLGALRRAGVPMQRIRPAAKQLNTEEDTSSPARFAKPGRSSTRWPRSMASVSARA